MTYQLDERLKQDSFFVKNLKLCELRLMNQSLLPWVILIPKRPNVVEIMDLSEEDYLQLCQEIHMVSKKVKTLFEPDKLNIATLGNVVSQLHIHIIGRYEKDPFFPKPVWGIIPTPYTDAQKDEVIFRLA